MRLAHLRSHTNVQCVVVVELIGKFDWSVKSLFIVVKLVHTVCHTDILIKFMSIQFGSL